MGAVSSVVDTVSNAVSDVVSPVIDVASNVVKAVADNPVAAIGLAAATGGASLLGDAGLTAATDLGAAAASDVAAPVLDTGLSSLANIPADIGGALPAGGGLTAAQAAGTGASTLGSLANIPAEIGGALPAGGGLTAAQAAGPEAVMSGATGLSDLAAAPAGTIGTTSNFATGLQTNAVIDPVTGQVTNVPTGQSLSGTTGTATPGTLQTASLPQGLTKAVSQVLSPTSTTSGSPSSSSTYNFTDILGSLAQAGITGDKTGRTLLQPSMFSTSNPEGLTNLLGALRQLNLSPDSTKLPLSEYDPKLIKAVRQNMFARGGQPHHVQHPEAEPGEPIYRTGGHSNYVDGKGDGQSDDIPAMLAKGEYVLDSELVSHLGNGSNEAGAKVLDKFREAIRRHKRSSGVDKIPPKAKKLTSYLKEAERG
jgi:hypothetical protein